MPSGCQGARRRRRSRRNERFAAYAQAHPQLAAEFKRRMAGDLPADFAERAAAFIQDVATKGETIASRKASQNALQFFGPLLPELLGGSADLAGSNLTLWKAPRASPPKTPAATMSTMAYVNSGMSAIMNGVALHGGLVPYGATFLDFHGIRAQRGAHVGADEAAGALCLHPRLQRSRRRRSDPPAVEQLASLRYTPNPGHLASGRCGGIRHRLDRGPGASRRSQRADLLAARTWPTACVTKPPWATRRAAATCSRTASANPS